MIAEKVIFLDVDGVLNTHVDPGDNGGLHLDKVRHLASAVIETKAKIVLSSAWRYMGFGRDSVFGQCLSGVHRWFGDVIIDATIGMTPLEKMPEDRDVTIRRWLEENGLPTWWVALDDLSCIVRLGDRHSVVTDGSKGMTYDNMLELMAKLGGRVLE